MPAQSSWSRYYPAPSHDQTASSLVWKAGHLNASHQPHTKRKSTSQSGGKGKDRCQGKCVRVTACLQVKYQSFFLYLMFASKSCVFLLLELAEWFSSSLDYWWRT